MTATQPPLSNADPSTHRATCPETEALEQPVTLKALFWAFTGLALQGFGGVLAVVQHELAEKKRWLTRDQFMNDWAVAQVLPGPNVINLSMMIGDRYFGFRGAMVALLGMLTLPLMLVLLLAVLLSGVADQPQVQGALRGMSAVAAGLIAATGLKVFPGLKQNVLPALIQYALIASTFIATAVLRWRLMGLLLGLGRLGMLLAWHHVGGQAKKPEVP